MPERLKRLLSSLHRHKEIEKAQAHIKQAEDQKDSVVAKPATYGPPAIQPRQSFETFHPIDLWQTAYDRLDKKQQQILLRTESSLQSKNKTSGLTQLIDEIIQVTKQQYEAYQQKSDKTLRKVSRKIIDALLSYSEIISAVAGLDPTQHAASAWAVLSLSLKIPQNRHDARNALFESSEYLADVITQCAFIEQRFYLGGHPDIQRHVETAIINLYKAILHYSAQIWNAQQPDIGRNLSDCFTTITGHPLTELKISVEKERDSLRRWIELGGYLHHENEAENILLKIDELGESLKLLLQQSSLMHLRVVEGALYNSHIHEHEDFCLPGTRVELLSRITDWAKSDDKFIFWLNGMAGTGKSTIARTVAQGFKEQGLLASQDSCAIKTDPGITSKFLRDQFDQLLLQPLLNLQLDQSTTIVIVIDALDECDGDNDIKLIIHLLFKFQKIKSVRLRVVLTSRPELPIRLGFDDEKRHGKNRQELVLHELPAPVIEHDIRLFLEYKLSVIQRERSLPSNWPGNQKLDQLVQMALPLFIFAATLCRFVGDEDWLPEERLTAVLQDKATTSTSDMDRTYLPVLNQLLVAKNKKDWERLMQEFQNIIGVIVLLATPLSVITLARLTGIPATDLEAPVRILHLSFRDFLIHTEGDFRINERNTHRKIALNCLRIMDCQLRHNICDLASYGIQCKDIDPHIIQEHLPTDLQYSCYYWIHHLKHSQAGISETDILSFLRKRFLHWLEALALMGKISEVAGMIKTLESSKWKKADSALAEFLYDARRFTLQNAYMAGIAPLQLYCSGLLFAPAQSVIKGIFLGEISKRIQPLQTVMDSWGSMLQTLEGHSDSVGSVAFSPDGLTLASGSGDNTIKLWDTATGTQRQTLEGHSDWVGSVAFSPDGLTLASGSDDHTIKLWDTATGTQRQTLEGHSDWVNSMAFSPDMLTLASGSDDNTIKLWDTATGTQRQTLKGHSDWVGSVAFSPDGLTLASGSGDNTIKLWDTATGTQRQTLEGHLDSVGSVAFSPDGLTLASGSDDHTIKLWDTVTGTQRQTLKGHSDSVGSVAFSPDGLTLASGSDNNTIKLWDTVTGTQRQTLEGHSGWVRSVAFSPDGLTLASGSGDNTIKLWDTATGTQRQTLKGHSDRVRSLAFSPNRLTLASGSGDHTIKLWDTATGTQRQTLEGHSDRVHSVAFSPDGLTLASGSGDHTIKLWDTATGTQRQTLKGHSDRVRSVAFSPDGLTLASGSGDHTIKLWDTATGTQRQTLKGHSDRVRSVAFSPNRLTLASGSGDHTIKLWDTATGTRRQTLEGHSDRVCSVAFSPDGLTLASGSDDNTIKLWDTAIGTRRQTLKGHSGTVRSVAFSPDGLTLASGSDDHTIKLWDTATGTQRQTLKGHSDRVHSVASSLNTAPEKTYGDAQISLSETWISLGGENLLWLPVEFRSFTCQAVKDATLALGYQDGRVWVTNFYTYTI
ncbi:hypothetical protein N7488_004421 [Penicillium malachiteum]|nr:hypothetical protein N7488_004421 [Penicillium malachiteum]